MYLWEFGQNQSTGSEDNAWKPYFGYFKVPVWSWKLGQCHQNLINSSPPPNNVSMQVWLKSINWLQKIMHGNERGCQRDPHRKQYIPAPSRWGGGGEHRGQQYWWIKSQSTIFQSCLDDFLSSWQALDKVSCPRTRHSDTCESQTSNLSFPSLTLPTEPLCFPSRNDNKSKKNYMHEILSLTLYQLSHCALLIIFLSVFKPIQQCRSCMFSTVVPTKSDSDVIFCLQLLSKTLTCTPPLELTRIDRSLVY